MTQKQQIEQLNLKVAQLEERIRILESTVVANKVTHVDMTKVNPPKPEERPHFFSLNADDSFKLG